MAVAWATVWNAVKPLLKTAADDERRFAGVRRLGVDEHTRHHGDLRKYGPKMLTGMVDLTLDLDGRPPCPAPGPGAGQVGRGLQAVAYRLRQDVHLARTGHRSRPVPRVQGRDRRRTRGRRRRPRPRPRPRPSSQMVDDVRRRVQQETTGHRGRKGDPLYGIRNTLRCADQKPHRPATRPPHQGFHRRSGTRGSVLGLASRRRTARRLRPPRPPQGP